MKRKHFRTIWHPIFYTVIKKTRPRGYEVQYEVPLGTLPPRADLLMLRKVGVKQGKVRELPSLFNRLGEHTILEYKGATATCEARDIDVLLGYGSLYGARRGLGVERVVLMLLSGRLEERVREGLERRGVVLEEVESGVWEGYLAGHKFVYFELEKVWRSDEANEVLGLATKAPCVKIVVAPVGQHVRAGSEKRGCIEARDEGIFRRIQGADAASDVG